MVLPNYHNTYIVRTRLCCLDKSAQTNMINIPPMTVSVENKRIPRNIPGVFYDCLNTVREISGNITWNAFIFDTYKKEKPTLLDWILSNLF